MDKSFTIYQVMEMIKDNKDLIFEIRDVKEKDGWYEHMLLIPSIGITSNNYFLKYYVKFIDGKWEVLPYIPLSKDVEWYISSLTKTDIQNSINKVGIRNN